MGRITIFVIDGNEACTRTIAAFGANKVPVTIIDLTKYPDRRSDMIALVTSGGGGTVHQSTPHVFLNERYIGGVKESLAVLDEWSSSHGACNASVTSKSSSTRSGGGSGNGDVVDWKHTTIAANQNESSHHLPSSRRNSVNTIAAAPLSPSKKSTVPSSQTGKLSILFSPSKQSIPVSPAKHSMPLSPSKQSVLLSPSKYLLSLSPSKHSIPSSPSSPSKKSSIQLISSKHPIPSSPSKKAYNTSSKNTYSSVYERYMTEIGSLNDPTDKRLALPSLHHTNTLLDVPPMARDPDREYCIGIPGDQSTILEMTQMLIDLVQHEDTVIGPVTYKKSFFGAKVLEILIGTFEISVFDAKSLASQLQSRGIFHPIHPLPSTNTSFDVETLYRLQCYHTPSILNSFRVWTEEVDNQNPLRLIHHLIIKFNSIAMKATDGKGILQTTKAKKSDEYMEFEEEICELQGIDLSRMNDRTKIAFGINVYNLMIKYATIKIGVIPTSKGQVVTMLRTSFLNTIQFNIGGHYYTFSEWEHGILRGNRKSVSYKDGGIGPSIAAPFSTSDPRLHYVVGTPDPRVLLCLLTNHGFGGCPEFSKYTAGQLYEELTLTADCYCEKDCNFRVDVTNRKLHVSKIFCMYRNEFIKDKSFLPHTMSKYARGCKKKLLDAMIEDGNGIALVEIPLDYRSSYYSARSVFDIGKLEVDDIKNTDCVSRITDSSRGTPRSTIEI